MIRSYWPDEYLRKTRTPEEAIHLIKPGQRVFVGSSCGEPQRLVKELAAQSAGFTDLEIVRLLSLETAPLTFIASEQSPDSLNIRSFYSGSTMLDIFARDRRFVTPINLSAVPHLFQSRQISLHAALIQVSPPDDFGWMSLGVSVDITMAAALSADLLIAQINPKMPRVMGQSFIHVNDVDVVVEHEEDILTIEELEQLEPIRQMALHVERLIADGSTLHVGLGTAPQAVLHVLTNKSDLGVHTQFLTHGIMDLVSMGVITNRKKGVNDGKSVASGAIGAADLYEFLHDNPGIEFHPSDYVNNPAIIGSHNRMVSIEVATAMDLTGQVVADARPQNHFSGVTGMLDFVRGSAQSSNGKSILLIHSTSRDGMTSRIVPSFTSAAVVVPRSDVYYVVSEFGVVNLFGKSLQERAFAMISLAHPDFRDELFFEAKKLGFIGRERTLKESIHAVYPLKLEEVVRIADQDVTIRPVKPVDERRLQEHFYSLDENDVVARFFHQKTSFVRDDVSAFYQIDYITEMTFVAVVGEFGFGKIVAVGGYSLDHRDNMAEVAFSVAKGWQGKGLSTVILKKLAAAAKDSGITGLVAYTSLSNRAMINLFNDLPYKIVMSYDDDMIHMRCRFDTPK